MGYTNEDVLEFAMKAERTAAAFYLNLSKTFSEHPTISNFWNDMASDEMEHEYELQTIKNQLEPAQLISPANKEIAHDMVEGLKKKIEGKHKLFNIDNLSEAIDVCNMLEQSEVNTVYCVLLSEFVDSDEKKEFCYKHIKEHQQKIIDFKEQYISTSMPVINESSKEVLSSIKQSSEEKTSNAVSSNNTVSIADEIRKLNDLKESGVITQEEFDILKYKIINS